MPQVQKEKKERYQAPLPCLECYTDLAESTKALNKILSKLRLLI